MNNATATQIPTRCTRKTLIVIVSIVAGTLALGLAFEFVPRICAFIASQVALGASILAGHWQHWETVAPRVLFWSCWSITVLAAGIAGWASCAYSVLQTVGIEKKGSDPQSPKGKLLAAVGGIASLVAIIGITAAGFSFGSIGQLDSFRLAGWLVLVVLPPVALCYLIAQSDDSEDGKWAGWVTVVLMWLIFIVLGSVF